MLVVNTPLAKKVYVRNINIIKCLIHIQISIQLSQSNLNWMLIVLVILIYKDMCINYEHSLICFCDSIWSFCICVGGEALLRTNVVLVSYQTIFTICLCLSSARSNIFICFWCEILTNVLHLSTWVNDCLVIFINNDDSKLCFFKLFWCWPTHREHNLLKGMHNARYIVNTMTMDLYTHN
jgi:hypothetical protein